MYIYAAQARTGVRTTIVTEYLPTSRFVPQHQDRQLHNIQPSQPG